MRRMGIIPGARPAQTMAHVHGQEIEELDAPPLDL
jgi:hypothetical protein